MSFLVLAAVPTELAGGRYPAPPWIILALAIATVVGAAVYLGLRLRRRRVSSHPPGPHTPGPAGRDAPPEDKR